MLIRAFTVSNKISLLGEDIDWKLIFDDWRLKIMKTRMLNWLLSKSHERDADKLIPVFTQWLERIGCINSAWIKPKFYRLFQENGFHLVRNHYYGAMPDTRGFNDQWWTQIPYQDSFERIQKTNVEQKFWQILNWSDDLVNLPRENSKGFCWNNPMFPPLDVLVLYGMICEHKPKKFIEIGSGYSTEIALIAKSKSNTDIYCIEPYPTQQLLSLEPQLHALIQQPIQELDLRFFDELVAGDFVFIDTTHSVKIGSDVNYIIFNILPRLAPGVIVHIHDIFLPYEYPRRWYDEISIFWNEQYLLLSYMMDNPSVELLLSNYSLSVMFREKLNEKLKQFDIWNLTENLGGASGASFWLHKL